MFDCINTSLEQTPHTKHMFGCRKNVVFPRIFEIGAAKTGMDRLLFYFGISGFFYTPTADFNFPNRSISNLKIPTKSTLFPLSHSKITYRTQYRKIPRKSILSATSTPKNQTSKSLFPTSQNSRNPTK